MKRMFGKKSSSRASLRLDGKVAVITGAASGIGAATARLFVSQGAKVIIADIAAEAGKKISSELGSYGHYFHCDVTKEADVAGAVDYAISTWGRLDIMFNNAGVQGPLNGLVDLDVNEVEKVMAVHVKGAVMGVKHAARVMIPAGKGVILFTGSTASELGASGPPVYAAAKAAVMSIMKSSAAELGKHGIRVNSISPHTVATPMSIANFKHTMKLDLTVDQFQDLLAASSEIPGSVLTVEQVAAAAAFLASDDAAYISGHNLVLDGAFSVTKPYDSNSLKSALQKSVAAKRKAELEARRKSDGDNSKPSSLKKEREEEDRNKEKEEKNRDKEEKLAQKKDREKERERERDEKEREKRLLKEEKARAKEEKAREKEEKKVSQTKDHSL
ncbi:hypothetical protein Mapa_001891 [Marchantia paleacea]|nr:hypothetical protein Mapa_001891 [Marchantia paleacea]